MAPPEFGDIGKAAKDLLGKEYNFGKTRFEAKATTTGGIEFTNILERNDNDGNITGEIKAKAKHAQSGLIFHDTVKTSNDLIFKVEAPEVVAGAKVELESTFNPYQASKEIKAGATLQYDHFTSTLSANVFKNPKLKVDAVVGHEGLVVGAQAVFDYNTSNLSDYSAAVGYSEKDYAISLHSNKSFSQYEAKFNHTVNNRVSLASVASWGTNDKASVVEFGAQYKLDNDTSLKTKFDTTGKVGFAYIQKIRPDTKATFGVLIDTRNLDQNAHKFGYSITFEPK